MSKNLCKPIINLNKNINPNKIHSPSLSDILKLNAEEIKYQHKQLFINPLTILSNIYSREKECINQNNSFFEKIIRLYKDFNDNNEKYVLIKSSFEKLNNDLFNNLFKQIDCYVEEIKRLNEKIGSNENNDYKQIIKKLNKEILENKVKLKNYEMKIKDKIENEEKLQKEIEYYKKRIIFFKNKININLISKNNYERNKFENKMIINKNNRYEHLTLNSPISNNCTLDSNNKKFKRNYRNLNKTKHISPPCKNSIVYLSPNNLINCHSKKHLRNKFFNFNYVNNSNNELNNNKNVISVNIERKTKGIFSEGDESNYNIIKINRRSTPDEDTISSYKNREGSSRTKSKIKQKILEKNICFTKDNETETDKDTIKEKIKIISPKNYIEEHLNIKQNHHNKNKSETLNNFFNFIVDKENNDINKGLNEIGKSHLKINSSPAKEIKESSSKTIINLNDFCNSVSSKNKYFKIFNTNTNQKINDKRKIFNIQNENLKKIILKCKSNYNMNNSSQYNTIKYEDKSISGFNESKINKFNQEEKPELNKKFQLKQIRKEKKINFNKIKNLTKHNFFGNKTITNFIDNERKKIINSENVSTIDNISYISNSMRKTENKFKLLSNNNKNNLNVKTEKSIINVNKKIMEKDKGEKNNKTELNKILKDMNEDYNNEIEMLNSQENQIKLLLNLIDYKEE